MAPHYPKAPASTSGTLLSPASLREPCADCTSCALGPPALHPEGPAPSTTPAAPPRRSFPQKCWSSRTQPSPTGQPTLTSGTPALHSGHPLAHPLSYTSSSHAADRVVPGYRGTCPTAAQSWPAEAEPPLPALVLAQKAPGKPAPGARGGGIRAPEPGGTRQGQTTAPSSGPPGPAGTSGPSLNDQCAAGTGSDEAAGAQPAHSSRSH